MAGARTSVRSNVSSKLALGCYVCGSGYFRSLLRTEAVSLQLERRSPSPRPSPPGGGQSFVSAWRRSPFGERFQLQCSCVSSAQMAGKSRVGYGRNCNDTAEVRAPVCLGPSIHQSINPPIHQSTNPPIHQSTNPPIHQSTNPFIHPAHLSPYFATTHRTAACSPNVRHRSL